MSRALGPRPPLAAGNAALAWVLILAAWGLIALAWLAWAAARLAALAAGHGHVPPFGTRWVSALVHGHAAQAWPGVPTLLVAVAGAVLAAVLAAVTVIAWRVIARRITQPGDPVAALSRDRSVRQLAQSPSAEQGIRLRPSLAGSPARPPGHGRYRAAARPAQAARRRRPGAVRVLGRHAGRLLRPPVRQDHLARHPVRPVSARPGRGHQRQSRPVGRHRRAARRVRLTDLAVRPAGDHRRRAAVLGQPAGLDDQRRSRPPAGRPLRAHHRRQHERTSGGRPPRTC